MADFLEETLELHTRDGQKVIFSKQVARFSKLIKQTLEDCDDGDFPVDVDFEVLNKIKEFLEHHQYKDVKQVKKPIKTSNFATLATDWDQTYFKQLSDEQFADLLLASSYLQYDALQEYCCAFLACQFKDLTIEDVRQKYDIQEEFTPELEAKIKEEYKHIFQDLVPEGH